MARNRRTRAHEEERARIEATRGRFREALKLGMSSEDAAAYANDPTATLITGAPNSTLESVQSTSAPVQSTLEAADEQPAAVFDIPSDWRETWPWPTLRKHAAEVSDTPINNRDDAEKAIEAEIARRGA